MSHNLDIARSLNNDRRKQDTELLRLLSDGPVLALCILPLSYNTRSWLGRSVEMVVSWKRVCSDQC